MQEYFERAAAVYLDLPGPSNIIGAGPSKAAYEEADEDMFASGELPSLSDHVLPAMAWPVGPS